MSPDHPIGRAVDELWAMEGVRGISVMDGSRVLVLLERGYEGKRPKIEELLRDGEPVIRIVDGARDAARLENITGW